VLNDIIPANPNQPYDMREVINGTVDENSFFEVHKNFAENIVVGFARLAGRASALSGISPPPWPGVLDIHSAVKGARLCASVTRSTFHCLCLKMSRVFCPVPTRSGTALSQWREIIVCL